MLLNISKLKIPRTFFLFGDIVVDQNQTTYFFKRPLSFNKAALSILVPDEDPEIAPIIEFILDSTHTLTFHPDFNPGETSISYE